MPYTAPPATPVGPVFVSGSWYWPYGMVGAQAGLAYSTAGDIAFVPIVLGQPLPVRALGVRFTTLFAGGLAAIGIYANNPATNRPTGTPIASVSGISSAAATAVSAALASPITLPAGNYWLAVQLDNTTAIMQIPAMPSVGFLMGAATQGGLAPAATTIGPQYLLQAGTYPTLPDMTAQTPSAIANGRHGAVHMQVN